MSEKKTEKFNCWVGLVESNYHYVDIYRTRNGHIALMRSYYWNTETDTMEQVTITTISDQEACYLLDGSEIKS